MTATAAPSPEGVSFTNVGGLPIAVLDRAGTARMMCDAARSRPRGGRPLYLTSANGEVLARCFLDKAMERLFLEADQIAADGQPMVLASRFLSRRPLPERVATTDLFHDVAEIAQAEGLSFYMLGASEAENARAAATARRLYPDLVLAGRSHGYLEPDEIDVRIAEINALRPDILWLAMGVPLEQQFMAAHGHKLTGVGVVKTSGGLFNFLSGKNKRAPELMQKLGLEWLWRIFQEPRRLVWRYAVTNPVAIWAMMRRANQPVALKEHGA
jgi:N-acetylglucosaminyldiphosphoundecaprenol N-acetyl-beta-D-mannosaminyltransferase